MRKVQHPISDGIRYNYLQVIEKLKNEHLKKYGHISNEAYQQIEAQAYNMNLDAIVRCFTLDLDDPSKSIFDSFTRTGNSRANMFNLSNGDPYILKQKILEEFMDIQPTNPKGGILRNAIEATISKYDFSQAFSALERCFVANNYDWFTARRPDQSEDIHWRNALKNNVSPREVADILLSTAISPQRESIHTKVNNTMETLRNTISEKYKNVKNFVANVGAVKMAIARANDENWKCQRYTDLSVGKGLYASSDIGNIRKNQEDSVAIMYHPKNPGFKMLIVSDGMGGYEKGELASSYIVEEISKWFNELPVEMYDRKNVDKLRVQYEEAIRKIDRNMHRDVTHDEGGATFCGAIITEQETIISNVGDSRAYTYRRGNKGTQLEQLTHDDNVAFRRYERGMIGKEDVRFEADSNVITQHMGGVLPAQPKSTIIPNSSYECLMLMSDGVSDCLYDAEIKVITENTPREKLAQMLVRAANARDCLNRDGSKRIKAGKDNSTVAVYDKTDER